MKQKEKNKKILTLSIIIVICLIIIFGKTLINRSTNENSVKETTSDVISSEFEDDESYATIETYEEEAQEETDASSESLDDIPEWDGETAYVTVNGNVPYFTEDEITDEAYEYYGELDTLGRCTEAIACIGEELMPTEDREDISSVYPTGWVQAYYEDIVDNGWLYNRCHLIGYQLTGENDNELNLITGTRYMNVEGMLPFENMVADYIEETGNHVMYRITPIFEGDNLLASGVLMEAYSVEDSGEGVCFCVYVYNAQPGITIDYATGESSEE